MEIASGPIVCPKCGSAETHRTGAFAFETRQTGSGKGATPINVIVYDRRCVCEHRFTETVPVEGADSR